MARMYFSCASIIVASFSISAEKSAEPDGDANSHSGGALSLAALGGVWGAVLMAYLFR